MKPSEIGAVWLGFLVVFAMGLYIGLQAERNSQQPASCQVLFDATTRCGMELDECRDVLTRDRGR